MKFTVTLTEEAKRDLAGLTKEQQNLLLVDYKTIQSVDLNAVNYRSLDKNLFEIKTKELRSLYDYRKGQIILVAVVYVKDGQKAPAFIIKRAKKILKKYKER
jgi:hypothetical protein